MDARNAPTRGQLSTAIAMKNEVIENLRSEKEAAEKRLAKTIERLCKEDPDFAACYEILVSEIASKEQKAEARDKMEKTESYSEYSRAKMLSFSAAVKWGNKIIERNGISRQVSRKSYKRRVGPCGGAGRYRAPIIEP